MTTLAFNIIKNVFYNAQREELWIDFEDFIKPSYTCAVFVNVPRETALRLKTAPNRDEFFQQHIRTKFKHYLWLFDDCAIFDPSNWHETADEIAKRVECEEQAAREYEVNTAEVLR